MKDFDNSLLTQLSAEESVLCFLISIVVNESQTLYYTTFDIPLFWDNNLYEPNEVSLSTFNYSADLSVDKIQMKFTTVDLSMPAILMNNNLLNNEVIINVGGYDGSTVIAEPQFRGFITEWDMDETDLTLMVSNELIHWNKKALRRSDPLCQWGFKSVECGYTGTATSCNKTYSQCEDYSNTNNFGGFRFLPSIEENEIWWGKQRT